MKKILLILSMACAPYEEIGPPKTVLLESGDAVVEVSSAMGSHDRWEPIYQFVFTVVGEGDSLICQIVVLELPDSLLEMIEVTVDGETDKEVWSKTKFHISRIPELGWSARLINDRR
ncbi:MAG TPA: hypothetical protein ENI27_04645 [bacterium]|nr:hypothetical protein [bacterium]